MPHQMSHRARVLQHVVRVAEQQRVGAGPERRIFDGGDIQQHPRGAARAGHVYPRHGCHLRALLDADDGTRRADTLGELHQRRAGSTSDVEHGVTVAQRKGIDGRASDGDDAVAG
jgi:hypothetical protein